MTAIAPTVLLLALASLLGAAEPPSDATTPSGIHQLMIRVNDWQVAHPYRKPGKDCEWKRGTWYSGVTGAYHATGDRRFLDQAMAWGKDQRFAMGTEKWGANRLFPADTWCELALITGDRSLVDRVIADLNTPGPVTPVKTRVWYEENWGEPVWRCYADSLFAMPVLVKLHKLTGEKKYLAWMESFFFDVAYQLWDAEDHVFYRDPRFIGKRTGQDRKVVWSRGSGWVHAGLARTLDVLPADDLARPAFIEIFRKFSASVARRQPADGLWRPNLMDAEQHPMPETSGTGFFCFALAWGIHHGLLDRSTYESVAMKAWNGLVAHVSPEGMVRYGQTEDYQPSAVKAGDSEEFITGAFLLAGAGMYELLGGRPIASDQPQAK